MSARSRAGSVSQDKDWYPTPFECALNCARLLDIRPEHRIIEPSAGRGNFVVAISHACWERFGKRPTIDSVEIDRGRLAELRALYEVGHWTGEVHGGSFTDYMPDGVGSTGMYDWVIANFPFSHAKTHIQHAHWLLKPGGRLSSILPGGFLHPNDRRQIRERYNVWREYGMTQRPPFMAAAGIGGASNADANEYSQFVWQRDPFTNIHLGIKRYFSWRGNRVEADRTRIVAADWGGSDNDYEPPRTPTDLAWEMETHR